MFKRKNVQESDQKNAKTKEMSKNIKVYQMNQSTQPSLSPATAKQCPLRHTNSPTSLPPGEY